MRFFLSWDKETYNPVEAVREIEQGVFPYFEHLSLDVGFPPSWHRNPLTGQQTPRDLHWSQIPDFGFGDIKVIWEPSRFGFVHSLVRAYWRTGEERYRARMLAGAR